ncbi:MAG: chromate transporter [Christensenellaceae bacterium]|nr:chromate transporter [Christensenellaceae bacterium]
MKKLLSVFAVFFKIGLFTFGGGYAMIALIESECVEKRKWLAHDEFMDLTIIAESTPGPISVNSSTYIGYRRGGVLGAIAGTLGVVLPSFIIIYLISLFFMNILDYPIIAHAFQGIKVCVGVLILKTGFKMFGKLKKTPLNIAIFVAALLISLAVDIFALNFSSIYLIIIFGVLGYVMWLVKHLQKKKEEAK